MSIERTKAGVSAGTPSAATAPTVVTRHRSFDIPSLDGIRALAIAIVFVAHAGWGNVVPGGFGVTIFFFLSGYLITTLLRCEWSDTGAVSLQAFYLRRMLRIFPPMYLTMAVVVGLSLSGWIDHPFRVDALVLQALHLTNYYILLQGEQLVPLGTGVFWSLAIEEHFYLGFPILLPILLRNLARRDAACALAAICIGILVWRYFLVLILHAPAEWTYSATDCRIDSILFGCIMGLYANPYLDADVLPGRDAKVLSLVAGAVLLAFSLLYRDEVFRETARYTLQGVALFPFFYLAVNTHQWPIFSWLNHPSAKFVGRISYSFYLIHLTIVLALQTAAPEMQKHLLALVALGLSLAYAGLMYRLVEQPSARLRRRLHREWMNGEGKR